MDIDQLKAEIAKQPEWKDLSAKEIAAALNEKSVPTVRDHATPGEIFTATTFEEWAKLSDPQRQWYGIVAQTGHLPSVLALFPSGATKEALDALAVGPSISLAQSLGLGEMGDGHVESAREKP